MDDTSSSQDHSTTQNTIDSCSFSYSPVHYDLPSTSEWNNQLTVDSLNTCSGRVDVHPTVQFDHFFRAAISSSLKPSVSKQEKDTSYLEYLDADFDVNTKAFYENEIVDKSLAKRHLKSKPKFLQMCSQIDGATVEIAEPPEIKVTEAEVPEVEKKIVIITGDENHKDKNHSATRKGRFSVANMDGEKEKFLKPTEGAQFRKKFSIVSILNAPAAFLGASSQNLKAMEARRTSDQLQGFHQIMESCLALEQTKDSNVKKNVRFDVSHEEQAINEINEKLNAEGLPDLKSCIFTQKEVLRRKKKRQHVKDKISGLLLTFGVFGVLLTLGVFLTLQLLNQLKTYEVPAEEFEFEKFTVMNHSAVKIDCHTYIGTKQGDVVSFRGIPYVDTPIKRWKKQSKNTCSGTVEEFVNATEYGNKCMQIADGAIVGAEDCMFLNIWTRSLTGRLPVVVIIHGGNFLTGSGEMGSKYDLYNFLAEKIVLITFNYRLNVFGWFASSAQANFGFDDQIVALHWIQENVHYFGGDPERVTLLGEGTGALSALMLALSERSSETTLFKNIWISNIPDKALEFKTTNFTVAKNSYKNYFFKEFNCSNYNCLRALDAKVLVQSYETFLGSQNLDLESNFVIDSNMFNQATERLFSEVSKPLNSHSKPLSKLPHISFVFGTNFTKNSTNTQRICNLFRLFSRISTQEQVSFYHYNMDFNETLVASSEGSSVDISAIIDRYDKFEKHGEKAIEFQRTIRSNFIDLINANPKNFKWEKFPAQSFIFSPSLTTKNNFFNEVCKPDKRVGR